MSQYAHTAWKVRDGFVSGSLVALAQTPDGYLWIGTDDGLFRFDGVRAVRWHPPAGRPGSQIRGVSALHTARDGTLWISTDSAISSWKAGAFTEYPTPRDVQFLSIAEDRDGRVWTASVFPPPGRICLVQQSVQCSDASGKFGRAVTGLFEDSEGRLWAGLLDGIIRFKPDPPKFVALSPQVNGYRGFAEQNGDLLVESSDGVARVVEGGSTLVYAAPPAVQSVPASVLLRDRDGPAWMGTYGRGLVHFHDGRTEVFSQADGLSGDSVIAMLEDREGSVWVATSNGLDRFRDTVASTYGVSQGLSNDTVGTVLVAKDGSVWIGTFDGLNHWDHGQLTIYREQHHPTRAGVREIIARGFPERSHALFQDAGGRLWIGDRHGAGYLNGDRFVPIPGIPGNYVYAIVEDGRHDIWMVTVEALVHVRNDRVLEQIPWSTFAGANGGSPAFAVEDPPHEGFWLGSRTGGVIHVVDGRTQASYSSSNGLGPGIVYQLRVAADGAVWVSTEGGLSRIKNGRIATLATRNGLPCDTVLWSIHDDAGSLWLYTPCGLLHVPRADIGAWIASIEENEPQPHVVRFGAFDSADGVPLRRSLGGYVPQVSKAPDGQIWFTVLDAVSAIDPRRLGGNWLVPPVQIEQVTADRRTYDPASGLQLPPLVRDLQIDYTALSLAAPEKNQFRIMLEGHDRDWQNVGARRQAFYNDLPPGRYKFKVSASNNSGVWNEAGAVVDFSIAPAYYQATWFRFTVVAAALAMLWAAYRLRVRQIAFAFDARLQERVSERTRIARELHDTLLQSFHGVLFRFQAATNILPDRPSEAKQTLENAIEQAALAITEGRDAVQNLRSSSVAAGDLAAAITTLGQELAAAQTTDSTTRQTVVKVTVEGTARDLRSIVRDEIYRIAGEAVRNAFRHADARRIEVEFRYDGRELQVRVRDDGKGIDRAVLSEARSGHFGLPGMRERAELIGGRLDVWSEIGLGTEVDLTVPAITAYVAAAVRVRPRLFTWRTGGSS